jgi:pyruvate, water dikinase
MRLGTLLSRLRDRPAPPAAARDEEALRAKHDALRRLTARNSAALDVLADLQEKAAGEFLFDTTFVRDASTSALALGRGVVADLEVLTGAPERRLRATLERVQARVDAQLREQRAVPAGPATLDLARVAAAGPDLVGGKMRRLAAIRVSLGLPAPDGFAVTTAGCHGFLAQQGLWPSVVAVVNELSLVDRPRLAAASRAIAARITATGWPAPLAAEVLQAFDVLQARTEKAALRVAVRSSGVGEDGDLSFAGQYATLLNVDRDGLLAACTQVMASQFGPRAVLYYKARGLEAALLPMSIGIVAMVDARAAGVLYTRSPTTPGGDTMSISGAWGLGPLVVEGTISPDRFTVSRGPRHEVIETRVGGKGRMLLCREGPGVVEVAVPGWMRAQLCLTHDQIEDLASLGARIEGHFGAAQDVEWAVDPARTVHILQARPLRLRPPAGSGGDRAGARAALPPPVAQGAVGSPGVASGVVVVAPAPVAVAHVPRGAVIVTRTASPDLAEALDRAAALVVEAGSAASHLATIARERRIPALFDVRDALSRLQPGSLVTVDAEMGNVYDGRQESLLRLDRGETPPAALDTPLFARLRAVNAWLVPLNLTDPRSRGFTPSGCRTLHDVLRYAHETAMREMFLTGSTLAAGGPRTRRLEGSLPLDVHIVDLGGGLDAADATVVTIDQVRSRPLLALWSGMTSVRWDARPAVDRTTLATLLVAGLTSTTGDLDAREANYAMVSDAYVNLQARFGYHFSRVDAFLADGVQGNYASLLFHGGAADARGRERRLEFIARVLAPRHWRVTRRGDALLARIETLGPDALTTELQRLGRLLIVTRQIDVALRDAEDVDRAVAAFERGGGGLELDAPVPGGRR